MKLNNSNSNVFLMIFCSHDFLFYVHSDYNTNTRLSDLIGNYGLNYALNPTIEHIHRNVSDKIPKYEEDFKKITIVATPALPIKDFYALSYFTQKLDDALMVYSYKKKIYEKIRFQYNAVGESLLFGMTQATTNFPNLGTQEKFIPLVMFYSIIFGGYGPSMFRLGKKNCICRALYYPIIDIKAKSGEFRLNHAIEASLFPQYNFKQFNLQYILPEPVISEGIADGNYFFGKIPAFDLSINIIPPFSEKYPECKLNIK